MINIGINGLGRIGKSIFLQLFRKKDINICVINDINDFNIDDIELYLKYDSSYIYDKNFDVEILSKNKLKIFHHEIILTSKKNPEDINWKGNGCNYVIDCSGKYDTVSECKKHNIDYLLITTPSKDLDIPTYIYGFNDKLYNNESIISSSSCTINCLIPLLNIFNNNLGIKNAHYTFLHKILGDQHTTDVFKKINYLNRSTINNILPFESTSFKHIWNLIPSLKDKIFGLHYRIPITNSSIMELNISFDKIINKDELFKLLEENEYYKICFDINKKKLVSCDFINTEYPIIIDYNLTKDMNNGNFYISIWYDNEWAYSSHVIRLLYSISNYHLDKLPKGLKRNIDSCYKT